MALALAAGLALGAASAAAKADWAPYDRPAQFGVAMERDVPIEMRDGVTLRADVYRPDAPGRFPVILTQTPYNKNSGLGGIGAGNEYLISRGYVHVLVDVRGTGSSEGKWDSFGEAEQRDGGALVRWSARQPWSTGKVGLLGPSYTGINQLFTAARQPRGLRAIFPIVPAADTYRDIVFKGGQANVVFMPFWLMAVAAGGLAPPLYLADGDSPEQVTQNLADALGTLADHLEGTVDFQLPAMLQAVDGGEIAFDGPFYGQRSPIEVVDRVRVPTFLVGGLHDVFQRGTPLLYERLKRSVPTRLLMGPWTHLGGSGGDGLSEHGLPSLDQLALRWFDRFLMGRRAARAGEIPRVTQWVWGAEEFRTYRDWPAPGMRTKRLFLRRGEALEPGAPRGREPGRSFLQHPLSGICTQGTSQWALGLADPIPCAKDNRLNELGELTYTTPPLRSDLVLSGPALADLWVTTTARDAVLSVRLTDVAPGGRSWELAGGWLAGSFRGFDRSRSRMVDGRLLQPWHPFTRESARPLRPGKPTRMRVEIFPTNAVIERGHSLRLTIGPSDFPHSIPPLPQLTGALAGQVEVLNEPRHRSNVILPVLGNCSKHRPCDRHPVPNLRRRGSTTEESKEAP